MQKRNDLNLINQYRTPIMGVAALWIFFFHEWNPIMEGHWKAYAVETFFKRIGFCGVDIFFFLSGMGLVYAIGKYSVMTFYKRRLLRTFIPFFVIAVAMMVGKGWGADTFLKNLSGYNFYMSNMYSFLWFGPAIMTLYLIFPFYHFLFKKSASKYQFTFAVLLIWVFLSLFVSGTLRGDLYGFTNRIPVFVIGVLAGWMVQEKEWIFTKFTWVLCLMTFAMGLYLSYKTNYENLYLVVPVSNCCIPNLLMTISGCCLLAKGFSVVDTYWRLAGKVILKLFGFFGTISLEFYCVQEWIGQTIRGRMLDSYGKMCINAVDFVCVLAGALALYGISWLIRFLLKSGYSICKSCISR